MNPHELIGGTVAMPPRANASHDYWVFLIVDESGKFIDGLKAKGFDAADPRARSTQGPAGTQVPKGGRCHARSGSGSQAQVVKRLAGEGCPSRKRESNQYFTMNHRENDSIYGSKGWSSRSVLLSRPADFFTGSKQHGIVMGLNSNMIRNGLFDEGLYRNSLWERCGAQMMRANRSWVRRSAA